MQCYRVLLDWRSDWLQRQAGFRVFQHATTRLHALENTTSNSHLAYSKLRNDVHSDLGSVRLRQNLLVLNKSPGRARLLLLFHLSADLRSTIRSVARNRKVRSIMERRDLQLEARHWRWRHECVHQDFLQRMRILHGYPVRLLSQQDAYSRWNGD